MSIILRLAAGALSLTGISLLYAYLIIPSGHLDAVLFFGVLGPIVSRVAMRLGIAFAYLCDEMGF